MRHAPTVMLICAAVIVLAMRAHACLWDRDTLAAEAEAFPGALEVIVGMFDRNPPLYYEMRLERVVVEIEAEPSRLDLYDDAGVACDRLGRHDEAIAWMAKKRAVLDASPGAEHEYRYLANLGTFHAHRWLANGASWESLDDLVKGRDLIAQAIALNPEAHFGREIYQLRFIDSFIEPLAEDASGISAITQLAKGDGAAKGLAGLIVLGNAWESPDAYAAYALALSDRPVAGGNLAYMALLRADELIESGRVPRLVSRELLDIAGGGRKFPLHWKIEDEGLPEYRAKFKELRRWADAVHLERTQFMIDRLRAGMHPDTEPRFWKDYKELPRPSVETKYRPHQPGEIVSTYALVGCLVLLLYIIVRLAYGAWRRQQN